jgi:phage gp36-like protein
MAYCTQQDLIDRGFEKELLQLCDPESVGMIDDVIVSRAIDDATADIDGYLAGRYELPLAVDIPTLRQKACDVTRFYLSKKPTEAIQKRYDAVIRYLEQVASGKIKLPIASTELTQIISNEAVMVSGKNVFSR